MVSLNFKKRCNIWSANTGKYNRPCQKATMKASYFSLITSHPRSSSICLGTAHSVDDWQQGKSEKFDSCDRPSYLKLDSNHRFFSQCDLEIWWMIWKNNRALLLYYVKLCASLQIYRWIQTGVNVRKRSIRVKIGDISSHVNLKLNGWPWKTIEHLFYITLSFVHHFKAMGEFKLELQSGNAHFWSKWAIFCSVWTWNLRDDLEKQ